jgi:putative transposase
MPRPPRDQSPGIRHITCRGNRRQPIFLDDGDRLRYLRLLGEGCRRYGWRIHAYCLLSNHLHLVASVGAGTISRGMQWLSGRYGQLFNRRHAECGHLFQGRFHSRPVEDELYAIEVVRYVDLNPVRARLVDAPSHWTWSSYRALAGYERPRPFHDIAATLEVLAPTLPAAQLAYRRYVSERLPLPPPTIRGQTPS